MLYDLCCVTLKTEKVIFIFFELLYSKLMYCDVTMLVYIGGKYLASS